MSVVCTFAFAVVRCECLKKGLIPLSCDVRCGVYDDLVVSRRACDVYLLVGRFDLNNFDRRGASTIATENYYPTNISVEYRSTIVFYSLSLSLSLSLSMCTYAVTVLFTWCIFVCLKRQVVGCCTKGIDLHSVTVSTI